MQVNPRETSCQDQGLPEPPAYGLVVSLGISRLPLGLLERFSTPCCSIENYPHQFRSN